MSGNLFKYPCMFIKEKERETEMNRLIRMSCMWSKWIDIYIL